MDASHWLEQYFAMQIKSIASAVVLALTLGAAGPGLAAGIVKLVPGETNLAQPAPEDGTRAFFTEEAAAPRRAAASQQQDHSDSYEAPGLQTRHFGAQAALSCRQGETPGDLILVNEGKLALPAGTRIRWQIAGLGVRGFFAITGPLESGETLRAPGVVETDIPADRGCTARVI